MTPLWLLHTHAARDLITGRVPALRAHVLGLEHPRLALSAISQAQLQEEVVALPGADRPAMQALIEEFFRWVEILPWDGTQAGTHVRLSAAARAAGSTLAPLDVMIAAQACAAALPLVSSDSRFDLFEGLAREDWSR